MQTKYFKIDFKYGPITERIISNALVNSYGSAYESYNITEVSRVEDSPAIAEMTQMAKGEKQQPTVPIQFVYFVDSGELYNAEYLKAGLHNYCTVEQIGAVLYVRGKE